MIDPIEFKEIYQSGNYDDPHGEYARRKGISRNEAKSRAYVQLYSKPFGEVTPTLTTEQAVRLRGMYVGQWLQESSDNIAGIQTLEVDFSELESKIQSWVNKGNDYEEIH